MVGPLTPKEARPLPHDLDRWLHGDKRVHTFLTLPSCAPITVIDSVSDWQSVVYVSLGTIISVSGNNTKLFFDAFGQLEGSLRFLWRVMCCAVMNCDVR